MAPKKKQGGGLKGNTRGQSQQSRGQGVTGGAGPSSGGRGRGGKAGSTASAGGAGGGGGGRIGNERTVAKATEVNLSVENEARLRGILETAGSFTRDKGVEEGAPSISTISDHAKKQASKKLQNVYDALAREGFRQVDIETALQALPVTGTTFDRALDWLCFHLPAESLPIKFSSGVRTLATEGGSVQVVRAVNAENGEREAGHGQRREGPSLPLDAQIISIGGRIADPEARADKNSAAEKNARNEQADLIRRYLEQQDEEDSGEDDGHGSGTSDEDWEVWADPREQMRRKQGRTKVDPEVRAISAAAEFKAAKEEATKAKEKGDKQRQMVAGKIIRELKEEMTRLGLPEEVLYRETPGDGGVPGIVSTVSDGRTRGEDADDDAGGMAGQFGSIGLLEEEEEAEEEEREFARERTEKRTQLPARVEESGESDDKSVGASLIRNKTVEGDSSVSEMGTDVCVMADGGAANDKAPSETKGGIDASEEGEEGLGMMFDEDAPDNGLAASILTIKRKGERIVEMWGAGSTKGGGKKTAGQDPKGKKGGITPEEQRMPKSVLQHLCQKNGWSSPRYDKLVLSETTASSWGKYRYSVTVIRPSGGRGKGRTLAGPVTYQLPEEEDGWDSVGEAQNAAATRALFSLVDNQPLYRTLPSPYREMWLRWDDQGVEKSTEEEARRSAFISTLISGKPGSRETEPRREVEQGKHGSLVSEEISEGGQAATAATKGPVERRDFKQATERLKTESRMLKEKRRAILKSAKSKAMEEVRSKLPMVHVKGELLQALDEWGIIVVSGETGSGKTTQTPQYILDEMIEKEEGAICNIVCTQPRRIAAVSVAERVAEERCEAGPGSAGASVGYHVRLDAARTSSTRLLFCTTGILLRRLASDPDLETITHVIVDEVHERTIQGDFLLVIIKDLLERRRTSPNLRQLRLVLMSATVDPGLFSQYFGGCPIISASGRTFGVNMHFLENVYESLDYRLTSSSDAALQAWHDGNRKKTAKNLVASSRGRQDLVRSGWGDDASLDEATLNPNYDTDRYARYSERTRQNLACLDEDKIDYDLLEELIVYIDEQYESGAILVFLPGVAEIQALLDRLGASRRFGGAGSSAWLLPLHSSVSPSDQRRVFLRPPEGIRKIVVATNIAETSITIDDVVFVVDTGKLKENRYNPRRGMTCLVEAWISRANAKQRRGRAGRVREGHCFTLFTKYRHDELMRPYQLPEMLRVSLVELCLQIKLLKLGTVSSFLARAIEPPMEEAIKSAMQTLKEVGAIDEKEELTSLGHHLAAMPVDVHIGKVMLYGAIFGCVMPSLTIAACLSYRSPFSAPTRERDAAERVWQALIAPSTKETERSIASGQQSDHLAMVAAYDGWRASLQKGGARAAREYCRKSFLSIHTLEMLRDMRRQFATLLADIGFIKPPQGSGSREQRIQDWIDDAEQPFNLHASRPAIIKAMLCAGLYPKVASMAEESVQLGHVSAIGGAVGGRPKWTDGEREVAIHPSSINHPASHFKWPFLVYHEKVQTTRVFIRECSVVSPYQLLLFGGPITVQHQTGRVTVDGWLTLRAPAQIAVLFKELRRALDALLRQKIRTPQTESASSVDEVINTIAKLLIDEEKPQV